MDFIERIFGVSPDGGDGTTELLWLLGFGLAVVIVAAYLIRRRARGHRE